jgi:hypothetical protein
MVPPTPPAGGMIAPKSLPPIPGGSGGEAGDPAPINFPAVPPPVVVIPEVPRK